jgi:hypothetical protein
MGLLSAQQNRSPHDEDEGGGEGNPGEDEEREERQALGSAYEDFVAGRTGSIMPTRYAHRIFDWCAS